ncbi:MAG: hypothetical protein IT162_13470 [Bryobacterales bacterium]|nr:hypothetical protein [Bryobacterales bacterium]
MTLPRVFLVAATLAALAATGAYATLAEYQSAKRKALQIEADRVPPQGSVFFTPGEVNAYAAAEARKEVPTGLRNPRLVLGANTMTGSALIDFEQVQTAAGNPPGALLGWLLRGERAVTVEVSVRSGQGSAQVDVRSVTVGGATLSGRALDAIINYYVLPRYPEAAIGRPFQLRHNVREVAVAPGGITFSFGAAAPSPRKSRRRSGTAPRRSPPRPAAACPGLHATNPARRRTGADSLGGVRWRSLARCPPA